MKKKASGISGEAYCFPAINCMLIACMAKARRAVFSPYNMRAIDQTSNVVQKARIMIGSRTANSLLPKSVVDAATSQ